nr:PREDICTED: DNA-directed DNA/RNA polymerase mu [Latimeria chalumnae]|eukprot:XP_005995253.1 PREDICTED: DNA-directed DNA/RNA polymerase mu [Latimeria chalumnae]
MFGVAIKEILEDGVSGEVESVRQSERYQALKLFTNIFGVGLKTAHRWYREGRRTLMDVESQKVKLTKEQEAGVLHYEDLKTPVTRAEADAIGRIVEEAVRSLLPDAIIKLVGGFRRGKESGHDVDFLITHPEEGKEEGLLSKVITWLGAKSLLLFHQMAQNSYNNQREREYQNTKNYTLDHFEKCFSIFRLKTELINANDPGRPQKPGTSSADSMEEQASAAGETSTRDWKAVRVDLVIVPISQFAYALLGWTGSQCFERELRRYASHEKNMVLNSHHLYDKQQNEVLPASTEKEIFTYLGLEYIEPSDRNA